MKRRDFLRSSGALTGALALAPAVVPCARWRDGVSGSAPSSLRRAGKAPAKLADINATDLYDAVRLGLNPIVRTFDADDNDIPYFLAIAKPSPRFGFHRLFSEGCVPGIKIEAVLHAERALASAADASALDRLTRALFFSFGGPLALPLNREKEKGRLVNFEPANLCEGLSGLAALVALRRSERAADVMEGAIAAIEEYWKPDQGWNAAALKARHGVLCIEFFRQFDVPNRVPFITGVGRALGPLAVYHAATRSPRAARMMATLRDIALSDFFTTDGRYDPGRMGTQTSTITWVMLSLARLATLNGDAAAMERVRQFYETGLRDISNALGWSPEPAERFNLDTEGAMNAGRVLETALLLGKTGDTSGYQRAEQILRARLLPSQLRDVSWIPPVGEDRGMDENRDVAARMRGSWGNPAPYGHKARNDKVYGDTVLFAQDVVGNVVGSLCSALEAASTFVGGEHRVNLLFDHTTDAIDVRSPYTGDGALRVRLKRPGSLLVRMPAWVPLGAVEVSGGTASRGAPVDYVRVMPRAGDVTLRFPLTQRTLDLTYRGEPVRVRLRGDEVTQMDNFGADLTFFDSYA